MARGRRRPAGADPQPSSGARARPWRRLSHPQVFASRDRLPPWIAGRIAQRRWLQTIARKDFAWIHQDVWVEDTAHPVHHLEVIIREDVPNALALFQAGNVL